MKRTEIFDFPENQSIKHFRKGSVATDAHNTVEMFQRLRHDEVTNLIRTLRNDDAGIDAGNLENRFHIIIVDLEGTLLSTVWIHKQ